MADEKITMQVSVAWWFFPYCHALLFFCQLFDMDPDQERLNAIINRAVRVRHVK